MAKYPLTEVGYVARDYTDQYLINYDTLCRLVTEYTGAVTVKSSFQQACRDERGFEDLRNHVMDYMRETDPKLVELSLSMYHELRGRKAGA